MLKACLILVIATSLASIGTSHFKVKSELDRLTRNLNQAIQKANSAQAAQKKAEKARREAEEEREILQGELVDVETKLEETARVANQQRVRANELERELRSTTSERNEAQRSLAQWRALGVDIQSVQSMKEDLLIAREEIAAGKSEREILLRQIGQLEYDLSKYEGPDQEVVMREGLKGTVVAVDGDWDFVVVSVGEADGARQSGKLMISREGKLVGKVQITTLELDRSIANVLPQWKQADIQVGDTVLY